MPVAFCSGTSLFPLFHCSIKKQTNDICFLGDEKQERLKVFLLPILIYAQVWVSQLSGKTLV